MNSSTEIISPPITPAVIKPRCPRMARQLAWMSPGLGHMYIGQLVRGMCFSLGALMPAVIILFLLIRDAGSGPLFGVLFALIIIVTFYSALDVMASVKRVRQDYRLKDYNHPLAYGLIILVPSIALAMGIAAVIRAEVSKGYISGSDLSELGVKRGDFMITSLTAYKSQSPAVGDYIVFNQNILKSEKSVAMVKAVAGDTISSNIVMDKVPEDHLLVSYAGEDKAISETLISSYAVEGKFIYRVWPPTRFGPMSDQKAP